MTLKERIRQKNWPQVEAWGMRFFVRPLNPWERQAWATEAKTADPQDSMMRLVVGCVVDEGGNKLLDEDDVQALKDCDGKEFDAVATAIVKANGLDKEAVDAAKN